MEPAEILVVQNKEIKSKKHATDMDSAMGTYTIRNKPFLHFLNEFILFNEHTHKEVAFTSDFTVTGTVSKIKTY